MNLFIRTWRPFVFAVIARKFRIYGNYNKQDIDDVVQIACMRICRYFSIIETHLNQRSLIARIARHALAVYIRNVMRQKRQHTDEIEILWSNRHNYINDHHEWRPVLNQLLKTATPSVIRILELEGAGLTIAEIATKLEISHQAIYKHKKKFINTLHQQYKSLDQFLLEGHYVENQNAI